MHSFSRNEQGFAAVQAILIVIIVALVAGTGFFVYHTNKKTNQTLANASKDATSSPASIAKKTTKSLEGKDGIGQEETASAAGPIDSSKANGFVDNVYAVYKSNSNKGTGAIESVKGALTPALYAKITAYYKSSNDGGFDQITCAQAVPSSISTAEASVTGQTASVKVTEMFSKTPITISTSVDLNSGVISAILCPVN